SVKFEFEYMERKRKVPDAQAKLQERYREVIREVETEFKPKRVVIGGKSMGGRVASYIAGDISQVAGLGFLGYPLHPPGKPSQLRNHHLHALHRPLLFISGRGATRTQQELLQRVVDRIGNRATLVWIDRGDHSLKVRRNDQTSLITAVNSIDQWIRREC